MICENADCQILLTIAVCEFALSCYLHAATTMNEDFRQPTEESQGDSRCNLGYQNSFVFEKPRCVARRKTGVESFHIGLVF